jgi:hypothetical protein
MAKRRKKSTTHRRRRRVGAASGLAAVAMKAGGIAGGVFIGGMATKALSTLDPKILGGALLLGGVFVSAKFAKGNPLIEGVGYGIAAKGGNTLMTSFGLISGIGMGSVPTIGYRQTPKLQSSVGGTLSGNSSKAISGFKDLAAIGALYDN